MATHQVPHLSRIIRARREHYYDSARDFWREFCDDLDISYSHYAAVENGHRFPDIGLALEIGKRLRIKPREICHLWAKAQMPDGLTSGYFDTIALDDDGTLPEDSGGDFPEYVTISKKNLPFLMRHPVAWDIASWIIAMSEFEPHSDKDIHKVFGIPKAQLDTILAELKRLKIIRADRKLYYRNVQFVHLTPEPEMKIFRDQLYRETSSTLLSSITQGHLDARTAYRSTFRRALSKAQANEVVKRLNQLTTEIGEFSDGGREYYYLQLGFGVKM